MTRDQTEALRLLKASSKDLTRQQVRTLKGQILSGSVTAAMKDWTSSCPANEGGHTT